LDRGRLVRYELFSTGVTANFSDPPTVVRVFSKAVKVNPFVVFPFLKQFTRGCIRGTAGL
jgi:hypothetical protein